jgi:hypothetical protein
MPQKGLVIMKNDLVSKKKFIGYDPMAFSQAIVSLSFWADDAA